MKKEDFDKLTASIKEAGAIKSGHKKANHRHKTDLPDIKKVRGQGCRHEDSLRRNI